MLDCCVECKKFDKMNEIYEFIKEKAKENESNAEPDLITYSTVIKGYSRSHQIETVLDIYQFLKKSNFELDEVIYNSILDGCLKTENYSNAFEIFEDMEERKIKKSNVTYSILIKIYTGMGETNKAYEVLDAMKKQGVYPEVIVYTCLIQTAFRDKKFFYAISLFEQMKKEGKKSDHVLYNTIVNGCLYNQHWAMAYDYTMEAFKSNVRMAEDIYKNLIEKLCANYCNLKVNQKCEFITKVLKELKDKNIQINYDTYSKAAKLIYKTQGSSASLKGLSPPKKNNYNNSYYTERNKSDYNKDQLNFQRKKNYN